MDGGFLSYIMARSAISVSCINMDVTPLQNNAAALIVKQPISNLYFNFIQIHSSLDVLSDIFNFQKISGGFFKIL